MYKFGVRWFDEYPRPYLVRRGIYKNWKIVNMIKNKEIDLKKLKWDLLKLNTEIESYERAVKVNGIRVFLTPIGETMIDEIESRGRFYSRELKELIIVLKRLDDTFNMLINNIGNIMRSNNF